MTHPPAHTLRDYVNGTSDFTTRLLVEAHLALCPSCPHFVQEQCEPRGQLPPATIEDAIELPSFETVWAAVEQSKTWRRTPEASVVPVVVLASLPDPVGWQWRSPWPPRVKFALLTRDMETNSALYLSYYAPRSRFPRHRHVGREESVILAGGYQNGDVHVDAGDWVIGAPGTEHTPHTRPDEECWCLSRIEAPGLRFFGWRGWVQRWAAVRERQPQ
jgi:putative transcriptional regulator